MDVDRLAPRPGRVIVELDLLPEQTPGGIIVPEKWRYQRAPYKSAVVLKCTAEFSEAEDVVPGDRVLLANFVGEHWLDRSMRVCLLNEDDVLGKLVA